MSLPETRPLSPAGSGRRHDSLTVPDAEVARLLAWLERDFGRVILLANNPALEPAQVAALAPGSDDLLVQFNRLSFFELFRAHACHKLHVFTRRQETHFGFDATGRPALPLLEEAAASRALLFTSLDLVYLQPFIAALPAGNEAFHLAGKRAIAPWYPRLGPDRPQMTPSTGFAALLLILAAREARRRAGGRVSRVQLVGFTGFARRAWRGHDWWLEQRWLARRDDLERLLTPPATLRDRLEALRWWRRHLRTRRGE